MSYKPFLCVLEVASPVAWLNSIRSPLNPKKTALGAMAFPLSTCKLRSTWQQEIGASVIEMAEAEYIVRVNRLYQNQQDIEKYSTGC